MDTIQAKEIVESYINWINSNYKQSLKNHRDALIFSEEELVKESIMTI